ncbi:MAG: FAD:protein FMN transferase [Acidimicrobiia bacterium]|nr:FAD:protein FMN transferase [Acidimicrobiia bacterium]
MLPFRRRVRQIRAVHQPILGTVLDLRVTGARPAALARAEAVVLGEIERLERIFSVFDADSELSRWRRIDGDAVVSAELATLFELSAWWQRHSCSVFNPAAGALTERWQRAEREGVAPRPDELAVLARQIATPRFRLEGSQVRKVGDCRSLNFNALAKGLVADLAAQRAIETVEIDSLLVNLGGDLVHRGTGVAAVGVENPLRPFDNEAPIAQVRLGNAGLATSGPARRGFTVAGQRHGQLLDPRTGRPASAVSSATVVGPDAASADAAALVLGVLDPAAGLAWLDSLPAPPRSVVGAPPTAAIGAAGATGASSAGGRLAALVVDGAGTQFRNAAWSELEARR